LPVLPAAESVAVPLDVVAGAARIQGEVRVSTGPTTPADLLPVLQSLTDAIVESTVQTVRAQGYTITCKKGCGACCRQLVPISATEARRLRNLVNELPEPRRSEIQARFRYAQRRLQQAGLLTNLLDLGHETKEQRQALALDYFYQGIPCPFLNEEACSIHPDRPLICREYLVTSVAAHCARPRPETVRRIAIPTQVSKALLRLESDPPGKTERMVPLVLALQWADAHPEDWPVRPGPELLGDFFAQLA
jgi:Fe-S-cluster containining protein